MKRIGILTCGGDAPGLNAAIRGVVKSVKELYNIESLGFYFGFKGLIENNFTILNDTSGFLTRGGTILKTSREKPFKGDNSKDKLNSILDTYRRNNLDSLVILGGNGTMKTACLLQKELDINVIALPKTIDNDIYGTDTSFGFSSAVDIATETIDRIHTTATSHQRVMVVEVMGHKAGWIALHAGLASGSDVILLPEIPFSFNNIYKIIEKRILLKKDSTIICVGEGAISEDEIDLPREKIEKNRKYLSIGQKIANNIDKYTPYDSRLTVLGYVQRGGTPNAFDRNLATILGSSTAKLIDSNNYGNLVSYINNEAVPVPLENIAGKLKVVDKNDYFLQSGRSIGISFGD